MAWNQGLTGTHLNIAAYGGSSLRVVAGPGTGKTFALMRRITRLIEVENVPPHQILAVTFTRTAAGDLVEKIATLGAPGADQVSAKTLHSLSFGLLSKAAVLQTLGRVARPLLGCEINTLVCDLQQQFGGKREVKRLIAAFEAYWATLQSHDVGWPTDPVEQQFDHALKQWLIFHRSMLIGEVVPLAYDFVSNNPAHPDIPAFTQIVVDEYQDLNRADQALIDVLAANAAVTVVGDEDQSIYSFRYANPEGIVEYPQSHADTHDELLNICRRCPQTIVSMANSLIDHNQRLAPKELQPYPPNGAGTVYVVQHTSVASEIQMLADYVAHFLSEHPTVPAGEVLVLANRRAIGNGIRDRLNELAQQHQTAWDARSFYLEDAVESDSAAEAFAVLTLLNDVEDRPSLRFWLGSGKADCRSKGYARVRTHCEANNLSPKATLDLLVAGTVQIPYTASLVARYQELQQRLTALDGLTMTALVDALFPVTDQELIALREIAVSIVAKVTSVKDLLNELRTDITQPELPGNLANSVRIMSLHKSKGLTARLVLIAGCVNGVIPSIDFSASVVEQNRQRQEQRRLFFVGLTRATDTLVISSAIRMPIGAAMKMGIPYTNVKGGNAVLQASSFVSELGPDAPAATSGQVWKAQLGF